MGEIRKFVAKSFIDQLLVTSKLKSHKGNLNQSQTRGELPINNKTHSQFESIKRDNK